MSESEVSLEDIYDQRSISEQSVSPNGEVVAFVESVPDPVENRYRQSLFLAPTDGSSPPRRLTRGGSVSLPKWSPDGSQIGFVSNRSPDDELLVGSDAISDRTATPQVWAFEIGESGDARQLTAVEGGVREFDWGPRGDRVVVTSSTPDSTGSESYGQARAISTDRLQYKTEQRGWQASPSPSTLYVVDVSTRESERLDGTIGTGASEPSLGMQPTWHPTDDRIVFVTNPESDAEATNALGVYVVTVEDGSVRELVPPGLKPMNLVWSDDGDVLAFTADDPADPYRPTGAWTVDVDDGELIELSADVETPLKTEPLSWESSNSILGLVHADGRTAVARFHCSNEPTEFVFRRGIEGQSVGLFEHVDGRYVVTLSDPGRSTDLYAGEDEGQFRPIARTNEAFVEKYAMPKWRSLSVESDGNEVEAFAYLPSGFDEESPSRRPVIVSPHGGPITCDVPQYHFDWTFWTSRGCVVLRVNYRGSSSYGEDFCREIERSWGGPEVTDTLAAVDRVVELGWADLESLYVQGFSYGATVAAFALAESDRFEAGVLEHGNYEYASGYRTGDLGPYLESAFGTPWENDALYEDVSPLSVADQIDTPCLIMAGGADYRAPASQSEQLYRTLRRRGIESELVVYPEEDHDVSTPDRTIDRLRRIEAWFDVPDATPGPTSE